MKYIFISLVILFNFTSNSYCTEIQSQATTNILTEASKVNNVNVTSIQSFWNEISGFIYIQTGLDISLGEFFIFSYLLILIVGIFKGLKGTIVIYRNFSDISLVFSILAVPLLILLIISVTGGVGDLTQVLTKSYVLITLILTFIMTINDNSNNKIWIPVAYITKLTLGFLFVFCLYLYNDIKHSRKHKDLALKGDLKIVIAILIPLLLGLIKNKEFGGLFIKEKDLPKE
ncbi:MAG: hypothetical protein COB02_07960 [Candidatus Cloacimonadota bacterium]|nr:MAG: hypothetical protein COB02_07960 [Candidatus Cloacimonadota bacterium]